MTSRPGHAALGPRPTTPELRTKSRWIRRAAILDEVDTARISVVIPAYNASAYLAATVQSVFEQTSPPREVIVVDDGSTDNTAEVARSLGVTVISLANGRVAKARNAGTLAASGEYIAYLDADDLWSPEKLAVQFAALLACPRAAFSFTDYRLFDERGIFDRTSGLLHLPAFRKTARSIGKINRRGDVLIADDGDRPVLPDCYILPSSVLVRRSDVLAIGGFDESVLVSEDYEFFLRLFKAVPAVAVMQPLLLYRRHAAQQTANQIAFRASAFDIARRVAESPHHYPRGDVRHLASTEFVRYFRLGIEHARRERFDVAEQNIELSLAARWTVRAALALVGARVCKSTAGRRTFNVLRAMWKRRPRAKPIEPTVTRP